MGAGILNVFGIPMVALGCFPKVFRFEKMAAILFRYPMVGFQNGRDHHSKTEPLEIRTSKRSVIQLFGIQAPTVSTNNGHFLTYFGTLYFQAPFLRHLFRPQIS